MLSQADLKKGFRTVSPAVNLLSPVIKTVESLQRVRGDRSLLKRELEPSHDASQGDGVCSELRRESRCPSRGDDIKDERVKAPARGATCVIDSSIVKRFVSDLIGCDVH